MKLEQFNILFNYLITFKFFFNFSYIKFLLGKYLTKNLFCWKTFNYSESYWFLYSNKKSIHELRYLSK